MALRFRAMLLCLAGALAAFAQTPATAPAFEVASVKPANPDSPMSIGRSGNRLTFSNYSLEMLILWAWNIRSDRLLGKPKGLDSVRYDVAAVAPAQPLPPGRLNLMMRSLLAERFKLVVHNETRELPYYAMVVDKTGPKIRLEEQAGPAAVNPFRMSAGGHLTGAKVSAAMLAKVLTDQTGRFIEDATGLPGVFDFTLDWTPDSQPGGADGEPPSPDTRNAPSIFTAVREQLGFRLDARKGPVEVVVIDRVANTPADN